MAHELRPATFREGSAPAPRTWMPLPRTDMDISSNVGITLDSLSDFVSIKLPNGKTVTIYGDGELWFYGTNRLHLNSDELPWR